MPRQQWIGLSERRGNVRLKFPDETLHDDIGTNADFVYEDYTQEQRLQSLGH